MKNLNKELKKKLLKAIKLNEIEKVKIMLEKNNIDLKSWINPSKTIVQLLENNYNEIFELLMKQGVVLDVDYINQSKILISVSISGHIKIVKLLLDLKADPNIQNQDGQTPLLGALLAGKKEIVKLLLNSKANPNIQDKNENTPLIIALVIGNKEIIKLLLDSKVDPDIKNETRNAMLMFASISGNKEIVKLLLDSKVDPNIKNKYGEIALAQVSYIGNVEIVKLLLESKADPNIQDETGNTSLMFASTKGHVEIVEILLENGANPNIKDGTGNTALIYASKNGNKEIIKLLESKVKTEEKIEKSFVSSEKKVENFFNAIKKNEIEKINIFLTEGFNVNTQRTTDGSTALMIASINGRKKIVELLIEKKASINLKKNDGWTALLLASQYGNEEIVKILLENGANPNIQENTGFTALMAACESGHLKIVKLLVEQKAKLDLVEKDNYTALMRAMLNRNIEIVKYLLKNEANPFIKASDGCNISDIASMFGYNKILNLINKETVTNKETIDVENEVITEDNIFDLLNLKRCKEYIYDGYNKKLFNKKGINKITGTRFNQFGYDEFGFNENGKNNEKQDKYELLFLAASEKGNTEIVEYLIKKGINFNIQDENEYTGLMHASKNGHEEIVKILLEKGADPNIQEWGKSTALIIAVERGHKKIIKVLLEKGALPDIQNIIGSTALIRASENGDKEIIKMLLDSKANVNIQTKNGWTSLMSASIWGDKEAVKLLLTKNANLDTQDSDGMTALMFSMERGDKEIAKLLLESKAEANIKNNDNNTASEIAKINGYIEIAEYIDTFKLSLEKKRNKDCNIPKMNSTNNSKIELENFDLKKKVFIVDNFFKSYFAKRLDKEEFETFLYDKGHEILNTKDYRSLCHGDRVKKLKSENKIFELRINRGDRIIFTFKEDGIIFLCVDNHDIVIKKGKNTEMNNLVELSARVEDISKIDTNDIIQNPILEYNSLKEIENAYENNRELYKLTEQQQNIINKKLPICLYGSAGSGKTTMLLKKIEQILRDNGDAQILFLTHNEKLLRYTKGLYETYSGYKLKQINFKDVNEFFKQELSITYTEDNYFSYEKFKEWFDKKSRCNVKLKTLSVLEVFSEIKGIIKGFVGFSGKRNIEKENIISKRYYTELKNKYSLLKNDETREEVYSLAIDYQKHLTNKGYYDENDLAMRCLREKNEIPKYDFLACDEVQDLTELQILSMLKAIKDEKNVFLTGDNNQAINLSFFDFGRLETLYHENYKFKELENSQISINHRSSEKIVKLAKKIATIREEVLLQNKKIIYKEETFIKGGNIPILAPFNKNHLSQLENKDVTVIVPNVEVKTKIAKNYENTILTTYESKGMERENIICVDLVDNFKDEVATIVKAIDNGSTEKLSNHYRHFFNLFYVATTRARKKLVFLDDIDNSFFNSLDGSLSKTNNENWLDHFIDVEDMSDDKLLKYAKEFEEKGLYSEALKNYKKMKEVNPKYILRTESFINFENKNYEEALEGFNSLEMWNECLECAVKLKDEKGKIKYQIKVYEKEKNYLPLAELYHLNSQSQLAFNSFIKYFREELPKSKGDNQLFFDILPEIDHKDIEGKDREFIVDTLAKNPNFYRLALDILVIDSKYKEAKELLELQKERSIEDEFKLFLLKSDGTPWKKGFNELKIKGEKNLYKNFYLNSNMSELNAKILRKIDLEALDLFIENGFRGNMEIIDSKFIEQILNEKKENLINYYLEKNDIKKNYIGVIEKYLEECIEKSSGKVILKRAKQLLDDPYDFILNFYEKDKIKKLINKQLKSEDIGLDIFKKSYTNLIEFDSYIKRKSFEGYNSELILNSLDYSSFELEDLMKHQMDHELDEILSRTDKLIPKELFEKLSKENQVRYTKHYTPYTEEKISNKLTVMNLSKEEKPLKINGKYLKNINSMTKVIIDVEDKIKISLGNEERIITLEDVVLGEDKVIFK